MIKLLVNYLYILVSKEQKCLLQKWKNQTSNFVDYVNNNIDACSCYIQRYVLKENLVKITKPS